MFNGRYSVAQHTELMKLDFHAVTFDGSPIKSDAGVVISIFRFASRVAALRITCASHGKLKSVVNENVDII